MEKAWNDMTKQIAEKLLDMINEQVTLAAERKDRIVSVYLNEGSMRVDITPNGSNDETPSKFKPGDKIMALRPTQGLGVRVIGEVIGTLSFDGNKYVAYRLEIGTGEDHITTYSCSLEDMVTKLHD